MKNWTLINTKESVYSDNFTYQNSNGGNGSRPVKYGMKRLRGGISDGIDVVTVDNGLLSLDVLTTRGFSIHKVRCGDVELKWDSPNMRPVHPSFVPISDPSGLGWLEGFTEWFVRCGLESNGSPEFDANGKLLYPLHGRIANIPADYVELTENEETKEISLNGKILETKLFFKKLELNTTLTTQFNSSKFTIKDTITNLSAESGEFELLYHINTGQPFASPGARVVVPFDRLAPRTDVAAENLSEWDKLGPEISGSEEVVFFFEPGTDSNGICKTMLINSAGDRALVLSFSRNSLPYFALWKSRLNNDDGYVCGLEPTINFPNIRSVEKQHGRVAKLNPKESRTFELNFEILNDKNTIQKTETEIRNFKTKAKIEPKPIKEWT